MIVLGWMTGYRVLREGLPFLLGAVFREEAHGPQMP